MTDDEKDDYIPPDKPKIPWEKIGKFIAGLAGKVLLNKAEERYFTADERKLLGETSKTVEDAIVVVPEKPK